MTDLCEVGMEDLWSIATLLLQVWFSVMVGLIMIPAMFGLSLGVTSVYIQILVKILEWATLRIQRGHRDRPTLPVPAPLPNGLIQREGGSMEQEMGELRRYRTQSISRGDFALSDSFYFYRKGLESIVDDQVTQRFSSEELVSWNLLTRTNHNFHYISLRLTVIWGLGVIIRYCVLFPLRVKNWLSELVHLMCYRICARGLSATIQYHNKKNKPQKGGICVANHTSPIDIVILANDGCYAMVGQSHSGLMGVIQRSMVRSCPHVWFERSEMRDRHAVTSSAKYNMVSYLLRMMTSWAIVVNVWYLPPMTRQEGEDATQFANRVKSAIAHQGGLLDMACGR
ncbi:unnamed protein product [Coregonus sp. 'balchen']|nr:unnamed protein product [Coregonus sp. 'balchen']